MRLWLLIAIASYRKWPIAFNIHPTATWYFEYLNDRALNSLKNFNAMLKFLNKFLGNILLYWLPHVSVTENMSMVVKDAGYLKKRFITYYTEVKV